VGCGSRRAFPVLDSLVALLLWLPPLCNVVSKGRRVRPHLVVMSKEKYISEHYAGEYSQQPSNIAYGGRLPNVQVEFARRLLSLFLFSRVATL